MTAVASHAGAWIETLRQTDTDIKQQSRPMRARGLKRERVRSCQASRMSRPMRARGLKPRSLCQRAAGAGRVPCGRVD